MSSEYCVCGRVGCDDDHCCDEIDIPSEDMIIGLMYVNAGACLKCKSFICDCCAHGNRDTDVKGVPREDPPMDYRDARSLRKDIVSIWDNKNRGNKQ